MGPFVFSGKILCPNLATDHTDYSDSHESKNDPSRRDAALLRLTSSAAKTTSSFNEYCGPQPPPAAFFNPTKLVWHSRPRLCLLGELTFGAFMTYRLGSAAAIG
jgi:hypothetical protein